MNSSAYGQSEYNDNPGLDAVDDVEKYVDDIVDNAGSVEEHSGIHLSKDNMKHLYNRHSFSAMKSEAEHISDEVLAHKLEGRHFFNPDWTYEDIKKICSASNR